MTLGDKQRLFAKLVPRLIDQVHDMGYECTMGDAYRDPRAFGKVGESMGYGHPRSAHKNRLAIDLNLFVNGVYLADTLYHEPLGEWWERQHSLARWGGRFPRPDGNHYSFFHEGVA